MQQFSLIRCLLIFTVLTLFLFVGCEPLELDRFTLTIYINNENGGSVHVCPERNYYVKGTEVELTAVSKQGWIFAGWQGDNSETEEVIRLKMDEDKEVTAIFEISHDENTGFAGGEGTEINPYLIGTAEQLNNARNSLDKIFFQIADIDLIGYSSGDGWQPIGDADGPFVGKYDGNGFKVSNLKIARGDTDYVGLFGVLGTDGGLDNIRLESVDIKGKDYVGSLAGLNKGKIKQCYAKGIIEGRNRIGGLVGENNEGEIEECFAVVDVSGNEISGGIVGRNEDAIIKNCYATGDVTGEDGDTGGLVGWNRDDGKVIDCYSKGKVTDASFVGGLIGYRSSEAFVAASYWDTESSEQEESAGGEGRTTLQMQAGIPNIKLDENGNEDQDGDMMYEDWDDTVWYFGTDYDYPILQWQD